VQIPTDYSITSGPRKNRPGRHFCAAPPGLDQSAGRLPSASALGYVIPRLRRWLIVLSGSFASLRWTALKLKGKQLTRLSQQPAA